MAWTALKAAVAEFIKTNGNREITGTILQNTLNTIISNIGENATFKGIATPTTVPGTPDGNLFYLAYQKGIYVNFNSYQLIDEVVLFENKTGNWIASKLNIPNSELSFRSNNNIEISLFDKPINIAKLTSDVREPINLVKGKKYRITNNSTGSLSFGIFDTDIFTDVAKQYIQLNPNDVEYFTPLYDSFFCGGYAVDNYSVIIEPVITPDNNIITINSLLDDIVSIDEQYFEKGNILDGENDDYLILARARTFAVLSFPFDIAITTINREFVVSIFDENEIYETNTGWISNYIIAKNTKFRLLICKNRGDSELTSINEILAGFKFVNYTHVFSSYKNNTLPYTQQYFEKGSLFNGNNDEYNYDSRCRSIGIFNNSYDIILRPINSYIAIHYYNNNGIFTNNTDWINSDIKIDANQKFRLVLTKDLSGNTSASLSELIDTIRIIQIDEKHYIQSANPNIIWSCREGSITTTTVPPNTKYGIKQAAINQYDRIRFTVRKTTDGYYVLIHDNYINGLARNLDGSEIQTQIPSDGHTLAELNMYDWGIQFGSKFAGLNVPLLSDALYYSNIFNLGVTLETNFIPTETDTNNLFALCAKYNVLNNLICINWNETFYPSILMKCPHVSIFYGGTIADFNAQLETLKTYLTGQNSVYWCFYPFGESPTDEQITLAKSNGIKLYFSNIFSFSDLINLGFDKGYDYIECANIYNIKESIREYFKNQLI